MNPCMPPTLKPGDTIGIAAPASPFDKTAFEVGCRILESSGFQIVFSDDIFAVHGFLAGRDDIRAGNLNSLFADPEIKGIWTVRGGYGFLRILPLLNYSLIGNNPKLFIGCSDISSGLNTIMRKSGVVTLHGPMITSLAKADRRSIDFVMEFVLKGRIPTLYAEGPVIFRGQAMGPVMGGNLTTLCHLVGTPFEPDFTDAVVFLEDIGEKPYRIDRMMVQMRLAGIFDRVSGICLGTFVDCGQPDEIYSIFEEIFDGAGIPVMAGFKIGHSFPNLSLPIGLSAELDTDSMSLSYSDRAVGS